MASYTAHEVNGKPVAVVYDMAHTKALYVRVKNTGQTGWAKKAAGTSDLAKAKDIAYKWWTKRELEIEAGYQLVGKPFKDAATAFLENYKSKAALGLGGCEMDAITDSTVFINDVHNFQGRDLTSPHTRPVRQQHSKAITSGKNAVLGDHSQDALHLGFGQDFGLRHDEHP